jgi:2-aminoethylphosphonate-pyruvate transaminase
MDKKLFTPGPLTTSQKTKEAMLRDLGSRDSEFIEIVREIRNDILKLGNVTKDEGYESIIMQGSGTFGIESVLSSVIGKDDKILIAINGAYGRRMSQICEIHNIEHYDVIFDEDEIPDADVIRNILVQNDNFTHFAVVHCETTTGIINPIAEYTDICKDYNLEYILDSMSIFGAVDMNIKELGIDYLISSSNKCVEGVPGFAFVIANKEKLMKAKGKARTLSLDLFSQWEGLEKNGQFRFTPPIQVILAFREALKELYEKGGPKERENRYKRNALIILEEMSKMGFESYLPPDKQSYIINTFYYPDSPKFDFQEFYDELNDKGYVIYPGKLTEADCFRIGNIGNLNENDMYDLINAVKNVISEMGIKLK